MEEELDFRKKLGIPDDAERVLIFAESSHWDPDWLLTSEEYYRRRVKKILDAAIYWLQREPERVYSVECIFFLRMYWDRNPGARGVLRRLVNEGRVRLSGGGITTPDTILPPLEAILRDYLHGQQWLAENGMDQRPKLAYLPDNFGNTPALPTVLNALGFTYTAVSRIDGIYFPGSDYRPRKEYPREGSSAELLLKRERSADFVWKDVNGSEVVCHLNPHTYGQGDTLVHGGFLRWMGIRTGFLPQTARYPRSMKRIARILEQLLPLSPTPYLFCPIGFDFNEPLPHLAAVLREYNRTLYPETGVFALNASLEDYLHLVSYHRQRLPILDIDPNPYFTGFYVSRPEVKRRWKEIVANLTAAESLLTEIDLSPLKVDTEGLWKRIRGLWDEALMANHHDFVTGTAAARVWEREQKPLLLKWQRESERVLEEMAHGEAKEAHNLRDATFRRALSPFSVTRLPHQKLSSGPSGSVTNLPRWERKGDLVIIETPHYRLELDASLGGCLTGLVDLRTGREILAEPGNDLISYEDSGGLWRMGQEFKGGIFKEKGRSSQARAAVMIREASDGLEVTVEAPLDGMRFMRKLWCQNDSPRISMRTEGRAGDRRTVTVRFPLAFRPLRLFMGVKGGAAHRPLVKLYRPTFWAAEDFLYPEGQPDVAPVILLEGTSSVTCSREGRLELVVARNAPRERAFGVLPLMSFPARGPDRNPQVLDYALLMTPRLEESEVIRWGQLLNPFPLSSLLLEEENEQVFRHGGWKLEGGPVRLLAAKRALRGEGHIIRIYSPLLRGSTIALSRHDVAIIGAFLCDARETDLRPLTVSEGKVIVPMDQPLVTVRVVTGRKTPGPEA